mgnify:CR=1 FL=1
MDGGSCGVDNTGSINIGRYAGSYHPTINDVGDVVVHNNHLNRHHLIE